MPFLGNTPANTFVSIAKQTITGNGGTSYSLSYPVTNANEIDVFYNNVRQEPTAAYTASGTTITFTEAIQSTDSVYVIFNGQAIGTVDAPAGAYLPTTGGTINGSVGVKVNANSGTPLLIGRVNTTNEGGEIGLTRASDNTNAWAIDVYGSTSTPTLRIIDTTATAVRLSIDGSGRITTPQQPAFDASGGTSTFVTGDLGSACQWVANVNRGSNFSTSNGRFTAPTDGVYYFWCHTIPQSDNNPTRTKLVKNGTVVYNINGNGARQIRGASGANTGFLAWIISLSTNDYVYLNTDTGINTESAYLGFGGYLLG